MFGKNKRSIDVLKGRMNDVEDTLNRVENSVFPTSTFFGVNFFKKREDAIKDLREDIRLIMEYLEVERQFTMATSESFKLIKKPKKTKQPKE